MPSGRAGGGVVLRVKVAGIRRGLGALLLGQTEIENLKLLAVAATVDHKEIGRLNIAVDDAPGVGSGQRTRRLLAQRDDLGWGEAVVAEIELQRFPTQQLHDEVGLPFLFADIVDGANVGVIQGGGGPGLAQEAFVGKVDAGMRSAYGRRAGRGFRDQEAVGDELEGNFAFEPGIERTVDVAHAAGADLLYHSVGPKDSSGADHACPKSFRFTSQ